VYLFIVLEKVLVSVEPVVPVVLALDEPVKSVRFGVLDEVEVKNALASGKQKS
jgi:hypothetical protein